MNILRWGRRRILDRYVVSEMQSAFVFGILIFTVLFVAGGVLFEIADLIIERGVSLWVVVRLFLYRLPSVVVVVIPLASLLATLLTFGRLSASSELVALKAAGVSFQRILRPVSFAAVLVALGTQLFNETLVPLSNLAGEHLMRFEVLQQRPSLVKERIFLREEEAGELKRVVYITKLKPRAGTMEQVLVQEFGKGRLERILSAEKGFWQDGVWVLEDGKIFEVAPSGSVALLLTFERQIVPLRLSPEEMERSSRDPDNMGLTEILEQLRIVTAQGGDVRPFWVSFHMRLAFPWACVVLAIVGAALGVRPHRSGTSVGVGMSILVAFAFYVVMSFSRAFAQAGHLPVALGAWIPNVLFLFLGGLLAARANR
ncbi:LptF/LptG family permease [Aminiphilus circumscriptus]|uniref:LptF/LptG family permease n=1 Tax=Aminiphilus circumscriptus TaxID=290732 RepID=UPI000492A009|nr:LptF/LptG family permease [Aminiphilus circumscriptus]